MHRSFFRTVQEKKPRRKLLSVLHFAIYFPPRRMESVGLRFSFFWFFSFFSREKKEKNTTSPKNRKKTAEIKFRGEEPDLCGFATERGTAAVVLWKHKTRKERTNQGGDLFGSEPSSPFDNEELSNPPQKLGYLPYDRSPFFGCGNAREEPVHGNIIAQEKGKGKGFFEKKGTSASP